MSLLAATLFAAAFAAAGLDFAGLASLIIAVTGMLALALGELRQRRSERRAAKPAEPAIKPAGQTAEMIRLVQQVARLEGELERERHENERLMTALLEDHDHQRPHA